jgi:hypothetical protein
MMMNPLPLIGHATTPAQHMQERFVQHLAASAVLPECAAALTQVVTADLRQHDRATRWGWLIPALQSILGDTAHHARPFAEAWYLLNAATGRLDDLQDGDLTEDPLPFDQPALHYQLVLSYYVVATQFLDDLAIDDLPPRRVMALRQYWARLVLRAASGQFRDLLAGATPPPCDPATSYQELAQAKSGAIFALAFGGTATLLTDDVTLVETFFALGEGFGTLLQLSDDIADQAAQPNVTLTLPAVYAAALGDTAQTLLAYWTHVYRAYRAHLVALVNDVPMPYRAPLHQLLDRVFLPVPQEPSL